MAAAPRSANDSQGTLSGGGFTETSPGSCVYQVTDSSGNINTDLHALSFGPTAGTPNSTVTTKFAIDVSDDASTPQSAPTDSNVSVNDFTNQANPILTVPSADATETVTNGGTIDPFAGVTLTDPNAGSPQEVVTITVLDNNGAYTDDTGTFNTTNAPFLTEEVPGIYTIAPASAATVQSELQNLVFDPVTPQPNQSIKTIFNIAVTDTLNKSASSIGGVSLTDSGTPVSPTITGVTANQTDTGTTAINPFSGVSVSDPDVNITTYTANITLSNALNGTLSGDGVTATATPGQYTLSASSLGALDSALQAVSFTPAAGTPSSQVTTTIYLSILDGAAAPGTASTSVVDTYPPAEPTISGVTTTPQLTTDAATVIPFSGVSIADNNAGANDQITITLLNTNGQPLGSDSQGTLAVGSVSTGATLTQAGTTGVYTLTADTLSHLNGALDALVFTPTPTPNDSVTTDFQLSVSDGISGVTPVTNTGTISVVDTGTPVSPTISVPGSDVGIAATNNGTVDPFAGVTIADPNYNVSDTVTITLSNGDANGTLSAGNSGTLTKTGAGTYTLTADNLTDLNTALDSLVFTPTPTPNSTVTTTFTLSVADNANPSQHSANATTSVVDTGTPVAPSITRTGAQTYSQTYTNGTAISPFTDIAVGDLNAGVQVSAVITVTNPGGTVIGDTNGSFASMPGLVETVPGVYVLASNTAANITSELDSLLFNLTAPAPNSSSTTDFTLRVHDSANQSATATTTSVVDSESPVSPTLTVPTPAHPEIGAVSVAPFAGVTIGDTNVNPGSFTATITLTDASNHPLDSDSSGTFASVQGLTHTGNGAYTLTAASASALQTALQGLTFDTTPTPNTTVTTYFDLSVSDSTGATAASDDTTNVADTEAAQPISVTGGGGSTGTTNTNTVDPFAAVTITDPNYGVTNTVTITLNNPSNGTLSGGAALTASPTPGEYTLTDTPANITQDLDNLVFTPTQPLPNTRVTTNFSFTVSDGGAAAPVTNNATVTDIGSPQAISVSGTGSQTTDNTPVSPFSGVTITDPNLGVTDTVTVTIENADGSDAGDALGTLSGTGFTETAPGSGTYTVSGGAGTVQSDLQSLSFTPVTAAPNSAVEAKFDIAVSDGLTGTAASNDTTIVTNTVPAAALSIGGTHSTTNDDTTPVNPFAGVTITDPNANVTSDSVTITLEDGLGNALNSDGNGTFAAASGLTETSAGVYTLTADNAADLQTALQALVFDPTQPALNSTVTTKFALALSDSASETAPLDSGTSLLDKGTYVPVAPTITGTSSTPQTTTGTNPVTPFANVTINDSNTNVTDTLTVTLTNPSAGTLTGDGLNTTATPGVYTLTGSASTVTSELDALSFVPVPSTTPNATVTTGLTLGLTDSAITTPVTDSNTVVVDRTSPAAVTITPGAANQTATAATPLHPFTGASISDPNAGVTDTVTITLENGSGTPVGHANGTLSGNGLTETPAGSGIYTLSGTASAINAALANLTFTPVAAPPNGSTTTTFKIALSDTATPSETATNSTTSVVDSTPAAALAISGTVANQSTTDTNSVKPFSGVTLTDNNVNVTNDVVSVTLDNAGGQPLGNDSQGTLSGSGFTEATNTGVYTASGSAAALTAELDNLVFDPVAAAPNGSTTTAFTIDFSNGGVSTPASDSTTSVVDHGTPLAISISDTTSGQATSNSAVIAPFATASISDPNANVTDTVTITLTDADGSPVGDAQGTLSQALPGGSFSETSAGVYTLTDTAANITNDLSNLLFTPATGAPNSVVTTDFKISVSDTAGKTASNNTTSVVNTTSPVAPSISGTTTTAQNTTGTSSVTPFAGVQITDPNVNVTDTLTITLTDGSGNTLASDDQGTFAGLAETSPGVYTLTGTAAQVQSRLDALTFDPTPSATPNATTTTGFTLSLSDGTSATTSPVTNTDTTVVDQTSPVAPSITGTSTTPETATGSNPVQPFANVTVTDPNAGATNEIVTVTLSNPNAGSFEPATGVTETAPGTYTGSASAAVVTQALDGLTFVPTPSSTPNAATTTSFTITVDDGIGPVATDSSTTLVDTANPAPITISGGTPNQPTTGTTPVTPFAGVTIADPNANVSDTVTITLSGPGSLSGNGLTAGATAGTYTLAGTAAQVTSELDALSFTPVPSNTPNVQVTTGFTINVSDGLTGTAATNSSVSVVDAANAGPPSISGTAANQPTTGTTPVDPFAGVTITDPNASATDTLTITLSNASNGTLTGTGLSSTTPGVYTLSGSAAAVTSALDALVFHPVAAAAGQALITGFTLTVSDGVAAPVTDTTTSVADTAAGTTYLPGPPTQYIIANDGGVLSVENTSAATPTPQDLPGITDFVFGDGSSGVFDPTGTAENIARLYQAAFGHEPTASQLNGYTTEVNSGTVSLPTLANSFLAPSGLSAVSNAVFVNDVYETPCTARPTRAGRNFSKASWPLG